MILNLAKEIAYKKLQDFFDGQTPFVLFGTGTSCSVNLCFGMAALKEHLLLDIRGTDLPSSQRKEWEAVVESLDGGADLESAMDAVRDEELTKRIICSTAQLIVTHDAKYSPAILKGEIVWPPLRLFERLMDSPTKQDQVLHVATPNYDLLAEHAFEKADIPYITGFSGQICRSCDWKQAELGMTYEEIIPPPRKRGKAKRLTKFKKHIRLYKVHGSLNTFKLNDAIVENNAWIAAVPEGVERMMITPGSSKYEKLHQNRKELLGEYDAAIEKHKAFLFVGFGFNDNQLNNDSIKRKLKGQKCPGLIITRDSNERIDALVQECENLWLVSKPRDAGDDATKISNSRYPYGLRLDGKRLWDSGEFSKEILGG